MPRPERHATRHGSHTGYSRRPAGRRSRSATPSYACIHAESKQLRQEGDAIVEATVRIVHELKAAEM